VFKKAEIRGFSSASYTADVRISGGYTVMLEGVRVARNLPAAEMIAGRQALLAFFDEYNPGDAVVIAVFTA
jgi:hypothetical protein